MPIDSASMPIHNFDLEPAKLRSPKTPSATKSLARLSWLLDVRHNDAGSFKLIKQWSDHLKRSMATAPDPITPEKLESAASSLSCDTSNFSEGLLALAIVHVLPIAGFKNHAETLNRVVRQLSEYSLGMTQAYEEGKCDALTYSLAAIELPLALTHSVPELSGKVDWHRNATERCSRLVENLLDHDGWPHATALPDFGPLMASWARSAKWIRDLKLSLEDGATDQLAGAVRQFLRLVRHDGRLAMSKPSAQPVSTDCLKWILKLSANRKDRRLAKRRLSSPPSQKKKTKNEIKTAPHCVSEWGESGILQSGWASLASQVSFDISEKSFRTEISREKILFRGNAMPEIHFDGAAVSRMDDFQIVCDEHDEDVDYVEFEMECSDSITLTRQLILSRKEAFLLVIDSIIPMIPGAIRYRCDWPLGPGIEVMHETETREVYLKTSKIESLCLPLALPEWKVGPSSGKLEVTGSSDELPGTALRMELASQGPALCVPLFIDLDPERSKAKRTWRALTVGEELKPVPPHVAAAFRIQIDEQQWFFYRVLTERGNRTFLGENFQGEFVLGRFGSDDGHVTELLRIE